MKAETAVKRRSRSFQESSVFPDPESFDEPGFKALLAEFPHLASLPLPGISDGPYSVTTGIVAGSEKKQQGFQRMDLLVATLEAMRDGDEKKFADCCQEAMTSNTEATMDIIVPRELGIYLIHRLYEKVGVKDFNKLMRHLYRQVYVPLKEPSPPDLGRTKYGVDLTDRRAQFDAVKKAQEESFEKYEECMDDVAAAIIEKERYTGELKRWKTSQENPDSVKWEVSEADFMDKVVRYCFFLGATKVFDDDKFLHYLVKSGQFMTKRGQSNTEEKSFLWKEQVHRFTNVIQ